MGVSLTRLGERVINHESMDHETGVHWTLIKIIYYISITITVLLRPGFGHWVQNLDFNIVNRFFYLSIQLHFLIKSKGIQSINEQASQAPLYNMAYIQDKEWFNLGHVCPLQWFFSIEKLTERVLWIWTEPFLLPSPAPLR